MVLILMLFLFFLLLSYFYPSASFQVSVLSLFKLGSTQGNEFLYEVKYEISGTELLMHFCTASSMAFPEEGFVQISSEHPVSLPLRSFVYG